MIPIGTVCVFRSVKYADHPSNGHMCEVISLKVDPATGNFTAIVNPPIPHVRYNYKHNGDFAKWGENNGTIDYVPFNALIPIHQGDANTVVGWSDCLWKPEDLKCT